MTYTTIDEAITDFYIEDEGDKLTRRLIEIFDSFGVPREGI